MNSSDLNISQSGPQAARPVIRQLDEGAINRIAAGEVVERPASAVKELVENAIDAGAHRITIEYADGGKTLIRVTDDGCGMTADDVPLALSRHATSKIDGSDLLNIHTFGFRGEALPSLGAVGRLKITSRAEGHDGVTLSVSGGHTEPLKPAALTKGTVVELRDLFFATPARLKFLRTDRAEAQAISDVIKRLAMAEPFVGFTLRDVSGGGEGRVTFRADPQTGDMFDALHGRLTTVLGKDFAENALAIDAEREGLHLTGYAALPTYSRGSSVQQFLFVNGRPVRDKLLYGALRAAYFDYLSRDRHPAACLFIDVDPHRVDVNVHPAKSEVRFREPAEARSLIVSGLRNALAAAGHRASTTVAQATLGAMRPEAPQAGSQATGGDDAPRIYQMDRRSSGSYITPPRPSGESLQSSYNWQAPPREDMQGFAEMATPSARVEEVSHSPAAEALPLGAARAQVHENYIIAQTETGIVIVDQHAAHERLVYEKLKKLMAENGVASQALLIPEVIELGANDAQMLLDLADDLAGLGLVIEAFGVGAIAVRETPAILGRVDAAAMMADILDELADLGDSQTVQARIEAVLSRVACHGSIRSGRWMRGEEMNALLREMESTPHSGQCNHGRPTYVELKLSDIERLFGRT
ncbi:DNA mismatch repair endonuclease MutL [Pacificibacter marinus]|uniref:DNA mismatch repair protein MutL n=1 Tax=Pacificibacter marinus TaxID=658057 RepID=A0A1Y5TEF9_9RHOB|nr:DNA mismatch repair endonuclease MutL [Pacificibacter marinus]SEL14598.1 DNA mismatch repair protein MutL [Pacificibacter marinus]SLN62207.1 DNA mismatch repair protein MutL [Pacificibacter marinus]